MKKFRAGENVGNRIFTPATVGMTFMRPVLMTKSMVHLYRGEMGKALVSAGLAGVSDYESPVAAAVEEVFPGWGFSKFGAKADQIADSVALAAAGIGVVANKRVHPLSRIGVALIMEQEIRKARQAKQITDDYRALTGTNGIPEIKSTDTGKNSMAEKLAAVAGAVATAHEHFDNHPVQRFLAAAGSLAVSIEARREADVAKGDYHTAYYDVIRPELVARQAAPVE